MIDNIKFNNQEYMSIRAEMIQRLSVMNSQSHTAILTIVTALGAGLTLCFNTQRETVNNEVGYISLCIISSLIFLIPIIYLLPLSVKSGENLIQIASISAYIRVFYDSLSPYDNMMNWETSNNILSNANVDKGKKSFVMKFYNEEYTVLATISFLLYIIFSDITLVSIHSYVSTLFMITTLVIYIVLGILAILIILFIHKSSGMKHTLMKYTPIYVRGYIKRAVKLGIIDEYDMMIISEKVNPYKEIELGDWWWSLK